MLNLEINTWLGARNNILNNNRTRARRKETQGKLDQARRRQMDARRNMKKKLRRWERDWWEEIIRTCEEHNKNGKPGEMYKVLRKLGIRGNCKMEGYDITNEEFKNHFEEISKERYELNPNDIKTAVSRTRNLRDKIREQRKQTYC